MRMHDYLKDKIFTLLAFFLLEIIIISLLILLNANLLLIVYIPILLVIVFTFCLIKDYIKINTFHNNIKKTLQNLDQKTFVAELLEKTDYTEGNQFIDYLYEINKNYNENINKYKYSFEEFKDYIELWCHEIKTPIATTKLILSNNKNDSILEETDNIDALVEQILYYARSEIVEKDYIITDTSLNEIINNVIKKNKKDLISKKIHINNIKDEIIVKSDSKWLEFILNQIIGNSIKYESKNITFKVKENANNTILSIIDNGIGIKESEIDKVFDKGFTGTNGRIYKKSTGIGLYLCKKLIDKLNHTINISSNNGTTITIVFPKNSLIV